MKIYILADNRTKKRGFLAEHGLSIYIEQEDTNILFDTGQSDTYCRNAERMDVDLTKANCVVLSHGHYDHCGGLVHFPKSHTFPRVYVHEAAFVKRYTLDPYEDTYRDVGIPWLPDDYADIKKQSCALKEENTGSL